MQRGDRHGWGGGGLGGQPETLLRRSLKQTPATEAEAPGERQRSCRLQVRRREPASSASLGFKKKHAWVSADPCVCLLHRRFGPF